MSWDYCGKTGTYIYISAYMYHKVKISLLSQNLLLAKNVLRSM